jgi:RNA polymerase sigma-70 factor, ECF subfamily
MTVRERARSYRIQEIRDRVLSSECNEDPSGIEARSRDSSANPRSGQRCPGAKSKKRDRNAPRRRADGGLLGRRIVVAPSTDSVAPERFRNYLRMLAELQLGRGAAAGIDPSDVVQQTLLDAHRDRAQFRGRTESEMSAWLRRLISCNLADAARARGRAKRDAGRERSLQAAIDASSARLESWLAAEQSSPSERAERNETIMRLVDALTILPEANRRALIMRHCQGLSLAEISARLGRTPPAVAGLLKRGLAELRNLLPEERG